MLCPRKHRNVPISLYLPIYIFQKLGCRCSWFFFTAPHSWLLEFRDNKGLDALLKVLQAVYEKCVGMNSGKGIYIYGWKWRGEVCVHNCTFFFLLLLLLFYAYICVYVCVSLRKEIWQLFYVSSWNHAQPTTLERHCSIWGGAVHCRIYEQQGESAASVAGPENELIIPESLFVFSYRSYFIPLLPPTLVWAQCSDE